MSMDDHHKHLRKMAVVAANEDEDALCWALAEIERLTIKSENRGKEKIERLLDALYEILQFSDNHENARKIAHRELEEK